MSSRKTKSTKTAAPAPSERPTSNEPADEAYAKELTRRARRVEHAAAILNLAEARAQETRLAVQQADEDLGKAMAELNSARHDLYAFVTNPRRSKR